MHNAGCPTAPYFISFYFLDFLYFKLTEKLHHQFKIKFRFDWYIYTTQQKVSKIKPLIFKLFITRKHF